MGKALNPSDQINRDIPHADNQTRVELAERQLKQLKANGDSLEREMFDARSRYLILNHTFRYSKEHRDSIKLQDMQDHRNKLFNNRRNNKLLRGIKGYAWAIEEGSDNGLHMHTIMFYDGKSRADERIAKSIGEYWNNVVTGKKGEYFNSNNKSSKNILLKKGKTVFVGQVNRGEEKKREALRAHFSYLAKADQLVKARSPHDRMFGTSQAPKKR